MEELSNIQLVSETMGITFFKFPHPLEKISGTVDMNLLTRLVQLNATGYTGTRPVLVKGTWQGKGDKVDCRFDIDAAGIPLDEKIINALPPNFQKLAREFNATGLGDIKAHIRKRPGERISSTNIMPIFTTPPSAGHPFPIRWKTSVAISIFIPGIGNS